jgi:hypothetical protein
MTKGVKFVVALFVIFVIGGVAHLFWLSQDAKIGIISDMTSCHMCFSTGPEPERSAYYSATVGAGVQEFIRCGGSQESKHKSDTDSFVFGSLDEIFGHKYRERLASIATLNSSLSLRAAQLCQYIGKCGSGLPAWLHYPPDRLRLNEEDSYTSEDDRHRILIETLTHSCGQGRREKDGLEIN